MMLRPTMILASLLLAMVDSTQAQTILPPATAAKAAAAPRVPDGASPALALELTGKWERMLRETRGWDDPAIERLRIELAGIPSDTLKAALETRNWDTLQSILLAHQGEAAAERLARAVADWRSGALLDETQPREAMLKRSVMKALGEADKDLVFIPIQPCTVWDTRFAVPGPYAGKIAAGTNKGGYVYTANVGTFNWTPWGGNPACDGTSVVATYGVEPYAVAYTLYTADATANGWVTAFRDGDPDPSAATISLYYTPGPTQSTTMVTRVGRAAGGAYDIRIASQFAAVHVGVSVIGYFLKPGATALDCLNSDLDSAFNLSVGHNLSVGARQCPAGYSKTGQACSYSGTPTAGLHATHTGGTDTCGWSNSSAVTQDRTYRNRSICCRVPGR